MIIRSLPYASTPYFFEANSFATWLKNNQNDKQTDKSDTCGWERGTREKKYSLRRKNANSLKRLNNNLWENLKERKKNKRISSMIVPVDGGLGDCGVGVASSQISSTRNSRSSKEISPSSL